MYARKLTFSSFRHLNDLNSKRRLHEILKIYHVNTFLTKKKHYLKIIDKDNGVSKRRRFACTSIHLLLKQIGMMRYITI